MLTDLVYKWTAPEQADPMNRMEAELAQVKDIYLDNLKAVLARGEKFE